MRRRLMTFVVVAGLTAAASTWWLYEGNFGQAIRPLTVDTPAEGKATP